MQIEPSVRRPLHGHGLDVGKWALEGCLVCRKAGRGVACQTIQEPWDWLYDLTLQLSCSQCTDRFCT